MIWDFSDQLSASQCIEEKEMNHDRQDKNGEARCVGIGCGDPSVCCVYFTTLDSADANMWNRDN